MDEKRGWIHGLVAALLVILVGAVAAFSETLQVTVKKDSDNEVRVNVNGREEVISLEGLAEGEERRFDVGEQTLIVKRVGDELTVSMDGDEIGCLHGALGTAAGNESFVWVAGDTGGGEDVQVHTIVLDDDCDPADCKKIKVMLQGDKTIDVDALIGEAMAEKGIGGDEGEPRAFVIKKRIGAPDKVRYRCEETGTELIVSKERAIEDSYVDPVTGCLLKRVEEPEFKVMKIMTEAEK